MLITTRDFSAIVTDWIDKTIIPVTSNTLLRSMMRGVLAVNTLAICEVVDRNKDTLEKLHYMKDGMVDTEAVCTHLKAGFPQGEFFDFNLKDIIPVLFGTSLESGVINSFLDRPYRLDFSDAEKLIQALSNIKQ